jgi:predicted NAD/FAD-binding protein
MKIAVIGSGISGLGVAHALSTMDKFEISVYEKEARLGGHSNTVDVQLGGQTFGVDTGFLVFNNRTYPRLIALFDQLGVASTESDMSFAVRNDHSGLEWAGANVRSLFADKTNIIRHKFWRMLMDIVRFNRAATALAESRSESPETLESYLRRKRFSEPFCNDYLLPMAACIWSAPKAQILAFPLTSFVHFFHNHGLLALTNRPQWRTVTGGSRNYVQKIAQGLRDVRIAVGASRIERAVDHVVVHDTNQRSERFDAVALACHSDEALALLDAPTGRERAALSAIQYQSNLAVLHTDASLMPVRKRAWSAWNYLVLDADDGGDHARVSLTYWINKLQPLPCKTDVFVTLNPARPPAADRVIKTMAYAHPLLNTQAVAAQREIAAIQGENRTYYAGAWLGYGFHEDGLASGQRAAALIGARF